MSEKNTAYSRKEYLKFTWENACLTNRRVWVRIPSEHSFFRFAIGNINTAYSEEVTLNILIQKEEVINE